MSLTQGATTGFYFTGFPFILTRGSGTFHSSILLLLLQLVNYQ